MKLQQFKKMTTKDKVEYINSILEKRKATKLRDIEKTEDVEFTNIGAYMPKDQVKYDKEAKRYFLINVDTEMNNFTSNDIKIIKKLIADYKLQQQTITLVDNVYTNDIITRSVRISASVIDNFSAYCKKHGLKQQSALALALINFMDSNSK